MARSVTEITGVSPAQRTFTGTGTVTSFVPNWMRARMTQLSPKSLPADSIADFSSFSSPREDMSGDGAAVRSGGAPSAWAGGRTQRQIASGTFFSVLRQAKKLPRPLEYTTPLAFQGSLGPRGCQLSPASA